MRFRTLRAALRLLGATRDVLLAWVPASFDALRGFFIDVLLVTTGLFLLELVGTGVLSGLLGWDTASRLLAVGISFFYLLVIGYLALARRTLHAAGLLLTLDMTGNLFEFIRTGRVRYDEDEARLHIRFRGETEDVVLKFAAFQLGLHLLWIVVNCMLNATWFFVLIPGWHYPLLMVIAFFAGVHWLISHKEFDFDWFEWFGTVVGVTGFSGALLYMILDYYIAHPYPQVALFATFAIGFSWATVHTKKYTLPVTITAAIALVVSYFWDWIKATSIDFDLTDERAIFRIAIISTVAMMMIGITAVTVKEMFGKNTNSTHH